VLSVVVPLYNEEESIPELVETVTRSLTWLDSWELVLVDDGSTDRTATVASGLTGVNGRVRLVQLARNFGQTAALQAGFHQAHGEIVVSMDGDLQNDPADIERLVAKLGEGYDLVAGYRVSRQDTLVTRKLPSWLANHVIHWMTGVPIRDNGCSLKAYRRELLDRLHLYSDMHRFIPAAAASTAGARIAEVAVRHHPRKYGISKYGLFRIVQVTADLLTLKMIHSFRERTLAMFAIGAFVALVLGVAFAAGAFIALGGFRPEMANAFVLPSAALLWLGLAVYLLMLGLIAEVALREERRYAGELPPLVHEEVL
jgi:glycosyltransferase involved in cell wall biosynthesis